jgi:hypothetical protein
MRRLPLRLSARAQTQTPGLPESIARLIDPVVEKAKDEFRMVADSLTRVFSRRLNQSSDSIYESSS